MQTNTYEPVVIFSLSVPEWAEQAGRELRTLEGCYKGKREVSFMMNAAAFLQDGWLDLCGEDGQESVLFLDNQRNAFLRFGPEYSERGQQYLGVWRHVPKDVAMARDAWTRDPQSDLYYVAG